jgi:hypothetical protein
VSYICVANCLEKTGRRPSDAVVFLDGVPQDDVIAFDEDAGYIIRYRRVDGKFVMDEFEQGLLAVDRVEGKVELSFK